MKVLIAGAGGQLAHALRRTVPAAIHCDAHDRSRLDITDATAVRETLSRKRPVWLINCAAYNMVDRAEGEGMANAFHINTLGPARLAAVCRDEGVRLLHFSTDFVFDGSLRRPYVETDCTSPLSVYGASKLAGENVVLAAAGENLVLRVCRLFGPVPAREGLRGAANFPLLVLRLARSKSKMRVVRDQIGAPTYTIDLAAAVWQLVELGAAGLLQACNDGEIAFDDYAREVLRLAALGDLVQVESVSTEEFGAAARRPAYSTLDSGKAVRLGMAPLRHWKDALQEFMEGGEAKA